MLLGKDKGPTAIIIRWKKWIYFHCVATFPFNITGALL